MLVVKNPPANAGDIRDTGSIPGLGRSSGGGHDYPLQYSSWRIPWTEEPGGLQYPWGRKESDTTEASYHALYTLDLLTVENISPMPSEDFLFLSHW